MFLTRKPLGCLVNRSETHPLDAYKKIPYKNVPDPLDQVLLHEANPCTPLVYDDNTFAPDDNAVSVRGCGDDDGDCKNQPEPVRKSKN